MRDEGRETRDEAPGDMAGFSVVADLRTAVPNKLTRDSQPPTDCFAQPVVYASKDDNGNTAIEVVDILTGTPIRFGGVTAATWAFALVKDDDGNDRARLVLILDNPTVIEG